MKRLNCVLCKLKYPQICDISQSTRENRSWERQIVGRQKQGHFLKATLNSNNGYKPILAQPQFSAAKAHMLSEFSKKNNLQLQFSRLKKSSYEKLRPVIGHDTCRFINALNCACTFL